MALSFMAMFMFVAAAARGSRRFSRFRHPQCLALHGAAPVAYASGEELDQLQLVGLCHHWHDL
jgi:hypothetical protein